ncbi:LuxR C-terminal-related transcriptional regulator [Williamsia sp.]|uniref:LuxR C-terminal-related transcriptional regulator n=1 Tax=Williamsia sp. TaxID=1872085 RepID=UPI001A1BC99A|nr:LuxR C-terminal-related transcriptional regulator [Williamsia sp.]MBJ7289891.1 LuxR family transcriptional regulator [Williamsia sp.]
MTAVLEPVTMPVRPILSDREIEVLRTWVVCDSKDEVGSVLFISGATVNTHISRIRAKYESVGRSANTKATLLARALQDGYVHIDDL